MNNEAKLIDSRHFDALFSLSDNMGCVSSKKTPREFKEIGELEVFSETNYTQKELSDLHARFREAHPDGLVTESELTRIYQSQFPEGKLMNEFAKLMIKAFDLNNDGSLDYKEFMIALVLVNGMDMEKKLESVFELWDQEKNGAITGEKLLSFYLVIESLMKLTKQSHESTRDHTRGPSPKRDTNKGNKMSITPKEFVTAVNTRRCSFSFEPANTI